MYLENSPFTTPLPGLRKTDLMVFGRRLQEIARASLPTSENAGIFSREELSSMAKEAGGPWRKGQLEKAFTKKVPVWLKQGGVLLPLDCVDSEGLALLVEGIDEVVMEKSSKEWLEETCTAIMQRFFKIRNEFLDPLTSLANGSALRNYLTGIEFQQGHHLLLVESLSPARSVKETFRHTVSTGRMIEEFNKLSFPLFHLGQSVYCFIIGRRDADQIKSVCHSLTTFARNGGLRRIHIGFTSFSSDRHRNLPAETITDTLLDEAWKALHCAGKRGPYSFCDYRLLIQPELFAIKAVDRSTSGKLSYRWKDLSTYSLVYLKPDFLDRQSFDHILSSRCADEIVVADDEGYFIIRPGKSAAHTKKWAASLISEVCRTQGERHSLSAGISCYPFHEYNKNEIARNCMKALLHGTFLGAGSCVVFDSLSLNVSGDAYFSESDLSSAVREYRKGLELAPGDINLLNSLGVACALMNMTEKAFAAFNRVLDIEPDNFMALFNKGLGEKKAQQYALAVDTFSRALNVFDSDDEEEKAVFGELQYQLGICHYQTGDYRQCIKILKKWYKANRKERGSERCLRFIGISYFHLEEFRDAATWLQRALVTNQFDGDALSMLGTVYLHTGEGDEIALDLCRRSVELEPDNGEYKIRYAHALSLAHKYEQAFDILDSCIRTRKYRVRGWLEFAGIHLLKGDRTSCERYLQKIFSSSDTTPHLLEQAQKIKKSLAQKRPR